MSLHLNVPQHMGHHHTPVGEGERRVVQYGDEWLAHVTSGGNVRDGNILCPGGKGEALDEALEHLAQSMAK